MVGRGRAWQGMGNVRHGVGKDNGFLEWPGTNIKTKEYKMEQFSVTMKSNGPMLMHSDRLVDPLSPVTKAHKKLTGDKQFAKTDEGKLAIAKSLYLNAFYLDHDGRIILPMLNIRKSLIEGARRYKLGKHIEKGVIILDNAILEYDGPKTPEKLWESGKFLDARTVTIGRAKVMAYRPVFHEWSASVNVIVDAEVLNVADVMMAWTAAGNLIGIGDFRPLFGRYTVSS